MMKPKTVITKWNALCKKIKADSTRKKAPGRKEAKRHAAMIGMKSMLEVEIAAALDSRKIKWVYEPHQFQYHMCPNWTEDCGVTGQKYTPDFWLPKFQSYIEGKGKMTLDTRKKMEAVLRHNPLLKIYMVFGYANNKLYATKNSGRYWEWAEKNSLPWSDKEIREEWFNNEE